MAWQRKWRAVTLAVCCIYFTCGIHVTHAGFGQTYVHTTTGLHLHEHPVHAAFVRHGRPYRMRPDTLIDMGLRAGIWGSAVAPWAVGGALPQPAVLLDPSTTYWSVDTPDYDLLLAVENGPHRRPRTVHTYTSCGEGRLRLRKNQLRVR